MSWIGDLLRGRCAHCRQGAIFDTFWRMNGRCPHCGIPFEREAGYFSMSIFLGYILAIAVAGPIVLAAWWWGAPTIWHYLVPVSVAVLIAAPWIFRYARIWWLYIDERLDPHQRPSSEDSP